MLYRIHWRVPATDQRGIIDPPMTRADAEDWSERADTPDVVYTLVEVVTS